MGAARARTLPQTPPAARGVQGLPEDAAPPLSAFALSQLVT